MTEGTPLLHVETEHRAIAILIALRTGLLKKCPHHDALYDPGQHDYQGACMVAAFLVNRDDPLVAPFRRDRAPLTQLLKTILRLVRAALCAVSRGRDRLMRAAERRSVSHRVAKPAFTASGRCAAPARS